MKKRVAFFDTKQYDRAFFSTAEGFEEFEFFFFETKLTEESARLTAGFDAVCAFVNDTIDTAVIDILHTNKIRLVAMRCAGYNNVDICYAHEKNIRVVRVPAYSPYAVAEHALALMMSLNRKVHRAYYRTRDNNFNITGLVGFDFYGKTAGVIGTGKIGRIMIGILKGLGMDVLAYDKYPDTDFAHKHAISYTSLDDLYRRADLISLHCPLTPETHHLINTKSIQKMRKGVMLINTSRGPLIDTAALIEGLKEGQVGYAGLDVYEEEGDFFFEDLSSEVMPDDQLARLLSFNNVIITSHQAFLTEEALSNIAATTIANLREYFTDTSLTNEVCGTCTEETCVMENRFSK
ncbi:2-hydroxyacid dehydrogenase [Chitinivibrio alkaliphilus]|uniref:Lactate dehydrogenase n=1 Tax=Chitinivibrio alkaliphilus ACht1 TaxID=1313304 RepID=U7D5L4_9BACT|nr:2-hydroxyacid dehydrogenase [Chitinivibrio alkaliphilus]ERP30826.1 lactate dehydrogenase [Chitinivibrio alkaliphilus ACht1]